MVRIKDVLSARIVNWFVDPKGCQSGNWQIRTPRQLGSTRDVTRGGKRDELRRAPREVVFEESLRTTSQRPEVLRPLFNLRH